MAVKREVPILRITEQRILTDVAVDAELAGDRPHPVPAGIAIDVAAFKLSTALARAEDGFALIAKGDNGVFAANKGMT
jgi:hypothetical protein